jgi:hypothetical protein
LSRAATAIAASANGRAKTVCGKRTNEAHFLIKENIEHLPGRTRNPKPERPKSERSPKSEIRTTALAVVENQAVVEREPTGFGIRASDFFRNSEFGIRI